jgi:ribose transport system ATP-binding protein
VHDLRTMTPREAIRGGIALLPANRLRDGQAADATVEENLTLPALGRYFRRGRLQHREARRSVSALLQQFQVVPPVSELPMSKLSGGNQQKALLAKWFSIAPQVFLMHEPTQGVDVGARQQIFGLIEQFRRGGGATLLISTEYDDLAHLCDRVMIFRDGRAVSELPREELSPERILERCYSGDLRPVSAT